ncbi:coiled-coil domain-containing protein 192-like [Watersipora subatra]|uniref:coiled-coil domain-containing protein 192-like n=1 Tax=Watersipora subatra TaxID=2589382 RepID=UPI00355C31E3
MNFLKRMGSASSSVRAVSVNPQSEKTSNRVNSSKDKELAKLNEKLVNLEVCLDQVRKENRDYEAKIADITKQLEEVENENERLVEENALLEEELQRPECSPLGSSDTSKSLQLKDQELLNLQMELQSAQDAMKTLRQRCKAKVEAVKAKHATSKQEQSLKIFELKDQISLLKQENLELQDKVETANISASGDASTITTATDGRSNIIIELSTQISEQEYKISLLEDRLEEKNKLISKLQKGKLSPRDAHSLIAMETEKTTQEMQSLAKELKMLKKQKRKDKFDHQQMAPERSDLLRESSAISHDSGAVDLSSLQHSDHTDTDNVDPYKIYSSSHSYLSLNASITT